MSKDIKNVLITGGTGFLGSHLVKCLLQSNYSPIVLKRSTSDTWRINDILHKIKSYDLDIVGFDAPFQEQKIDIIIHTACIYGRKNETASSIAEANIMFGLRLLEFAERYNVDTFFNTDTFYSTQLIPKYKNYCLSKKHFYEWLTISTENIKIINMKIEHMYGPMDDKMKFIPWLIDQYVLAKEEIMLSDGIQERDFIYVLDVVYAYLKVIENIDELKRISEFNVGTGHPMPIKTFILELDKQYKELNPDNTVKLAFGKMPLYENEPLSIDIDIKALVTLGWKPIYSFQDGIKNLLIYHTYNLTADKKEHSHQVMDEYGNHIYAHKIEPRVWIEVNR